MLRNVSMLLIVSLLVLATAGESIKYPINHRSFYGPARIGGYHYPNSQNLSEPIKPSTRTMLPSITTSTSNKSNVTDTGPTHTSKTNTTPITQFSYNSFRKTNTAPAHKTSINTTITQSSNNSTRTTRTIQALITSIRKSPSITNTGAEAAGTSTAQTHTTSSNTTPLRPGPPIRQFSNKNTRATNPGSTVQVASNSTNTPTSPSTLNWAIGDTNTTTSDAPKLTTPTTTRPRIAPKGPESESDPEIDWGTTEPEQAISWIRVLVFCGCVILALLSVFAVLKYICRV